MESKTEELTKKTRQLSSIIKLNNIIGFLPLDLKEILNAVSNEVSKLFTPFRCCFALVPLDWIGDTAGEGDLTYHRCSLCCSAEQCRALRDQLPVIVPDVKEGLGCRNRVDQGETRSYICVPIVAGKEVLGNMCLNSPVPRSLAHDELEVLLSMANQTAFAIQRARLFRKLNQTVWELQSTQDRLIRSERLAATGHMAANLAHEINNPTGIIIARLEWLLLEAGESGLSQEIIRDLEVIMKHARRIAKITRGLLFFARRSAGDVGLVDLDDLIRETVDWFESQYQKAGITCRVNLVKLPPIRGNRERLQQVMVNLLTNAKDAMPAGGAVSISTKVSGDGKWIVLEISDTGSGIPPEILDRVFEPFFTTKEVGHGTGLGLSIVYGIIQEHRGEIEVKSEPGQGSAFTILLPVYTQPVNKAETPEENG